MGAFREQEVVEVKVLDAEMKRDLENQIKELMEKYTIIDLQYSTHYKQLTTVYSALVLLGNKMNSVLRTA